jgi:hypothetical protein
MGHDLPVTDLAEDEVRGGPFRTTYGMAVVEVSADELRIRYQDRKSFTRWGQGLLALVASVILVSRPSGQHSVGSEYGISILGWTALVAGILWFVAEQLSQPAGSSWNPEPEGTRGTLVVAAEKVRSVGEIRGVLAPRFELETADRVFDLLSPPWRAGSLRAVQAAARHLVR